VLSPGLSWTMTSSPSVRGVTRLGGEEPEPGSGPGYGGNGGSGWLAEELDQGEGDQQQPGQQQDHLAGGLAPEHQGQHG
jgi:hypothetical protein